MIDNNLYKEDSNLSLEEIISAIEFCPLLKDFGISPEATTVRRYDSGEMVSDQVDGQPSVCLVASGIVDVYSVAVDGRDVQLNALQPGDCFGISNLLSTASLETVLRCRTETVLILIPKQVLISKMENNPILAMHYAAYCNQKIQFLLSRIEQLTIQSSRCKVIKYLLSQHQDGVVKPHGSREDLARQLGISRAALFRELSYLQDKGILTTEGSSMTILDLAALEKLFNQHTRG